jgi:hypothetical protein
MFWTIVLAILAVLAIYYIGVPIFLFFLSALIPGGESEAPPKVVAKK